MPSCCQIETLPPEVVSKSSLHPLDPLTPQEIKETSLLIRTTYPQKKWIFNSISLLEPKKSLMLHYIAAKRWGEPRNVIPRRSKTVLIENYTGKIFEVNVNLSSKVIEKFTEVPFGNQPTFTVEESLIAEDIVRRDIGVQKRCIKLGLENMDLVISNPWVIGYEGLDPKFKGRRLMQAFMYVRMFEDDNHYAHPLDFAPIVDMALEEVVLIEDLPLSPDMKSIRKEKVTTYPQICSNYVHDLQENGFLRKDIKPLQVLQPKGPSFTVKGNELSWQKFKMRIGFNYREGLVLHNVSYQDGERQRPLIYRASLAEMAVPYGDPRPVYHRKCAFDAGQYGLGLCTNSLKLGCDCLGTIKYIDGVINDHGGQPTIIKNAICIHEEDDGILYKHTEYRNDKVTVARSRKLIVSFIVTVANYEYAFYWSFHQDASIHFDVKATGIISTILRMDGQILPHTAPVLENVSGQYHQHIYAMRLDTMFDGPKNTVYTVDVSPAGEHGSVENPYGNGFSTTLTPIKSTKEGFSDTSVDKSRFWLIGNPNEIHETTKGPTSWKLYPGNPVRLMAKPGSHIYGQAGFAQHSVWVTPYHEDQIYPAGNYVNSTTGFNGLPEWIKEDKKTENEDIVLWHVFGATHIIRAEDFPIMPVETCGFILKPFNFFLSNPALDVPPPDRNENKSVHANAFRNANQTNKT